MHDSEKEPVMSYHFNINEYFNSQKREQLWARGVDETEKRDQLKMFVNKLELNLESI